MSLEQERDIAYRCIYSYCLNNTVAFKCFFAQNIQAIHGIAKVILVMPTEKEKVLTGLEENQVSLGESQPTYLPVYIPGGFLI